MPAGKQQGVESLSMSKEREAESLANHNAALTVAAWSERTHQPAAALLEILDELGIDTATLQP
jgi:hypothetical protein